MAVSGTIFGTITGVLEIAFIVLLIREIFGIGYPKHKGMTQLAETAKGIKDDAKGGWNTLFKKNEKKEEEKKEKALALEELGRHQASLNIEEKQLLDALQTGTQKLTEVRKHPNFKSMTQDIKTKITHHMREESKTLNKKIIESNKYTVAMITNLKALGVNSQNALVRINKTIDTLLKEKRENLKKMVQKAQDDNSELRLDERRKLAKESYREEEDLSALEKKIKNELAEISIKYEKLREEISKIELPEEYKLAQIYKAYDIEVKKLMDALDKMDKELDNITNTKKPEDIGKAVGGFDHELGIIINSVNILTKVSKDIEDFMEKAITHEDTINGKIEEIQKLDEDLRIKVNQLMGA